MLQNPNRGGESFLSVLSCLYIRGMQNNKESAPADIVLLASSDPAGVCHIQTASLDGYAVPFLFQRFVVTGKSRACPLDGVEFVF